MSATGHKRPVVERHCAPVAMLGLPPAADVRPWLKMSYDPSTFVSCRDQRRRPRRHDAGVHLAPRNRDRALHERGSSVGTARQASDVGRLTGVTEASGGTSIVYDARGNITSETQCSGNGILIDWKYSLVTRARCSSSSHEGCIEDDALWARKWSARFMPSRVAWVVLRVVVMPSSLGYGFRIVAYHFRGSAASARRRFYVEFHKQYHSIGGLFLEIISG